MFEILDDTMQALTGFQKMWEFNMARMQQLTERKL